MEYNMDKKPLLSPPKMLKKTCFGGGGSKA